jgi:hypothetical protein
LRINYLQEDVVVALCKHFHLRKHRCDRACSDTIKP